MRAEATLPFLMIQGGGCVGGRNFFRSHPENNEVLGQDHEGFAATSLSLLQGLA